VSGRSAIWRAVSGSLLGAFLLLSAAQACAQDFKIYSQNLLRFGHGRRTDTQCTEVGAHIPTVDIILIQELMVATTPCSSPATIPGTYVWRAEGPYGRGSYREYYGFLYSSTARTNGPTIALGPVKASAVGNYIRPPQGLLFQVTPHGSTAAKFVWVADAHLLWGGSSPGPRRTEAGLVAAFFTYMETLQNSTTGLAYSDNVIIAGDWNLPATDQGFGNLTTAGAAIQPNVKTSLNRAGDLSQPYDHFVTSGTVTLTNITTFQGASTRQDWRDDVSDHLGIEADVSLP
jgi:endonuclease/exonuclease/phosphatase family metal-dependent hydrolase